ncbi:MAG: beta-ketoacyl-[acyl-carrier-protein] synthase family protein [Candidatus Auribacterota bacterium]
MTNEKIVITGRGVMTPLGCTIESLWSGLLAGKSGIGAMDFQGFDESQYKSRVAGNVQNFDINFYFENDKGFKRQGRLTNFALVTAKMAFEDAGFTFELKKGESGKATYSVKGINSGRCAIILGIGVHNMDISEKYHALLIEHNGPRKLSPFALPFIPTNIVGGLIAEKFLLTGPSYTISTACASGTHALINAFHMLRSGVCDIAIAGGVESCITPYVFGGFDSMKALSRNPDPDTACRPFDKDRDGFVMSEGSGLLILETETHAKARGARILAELAGGAMTSDAFHITIPNPTGESAVAMLHEAMKVAHVSADEIGYINPHGTSTPLNDPNESFIIKQVFGDRAYKIPISSTKSMLGHSIGASGGIEAIVVLETILSGKIHPTRNLVNPDSDFSDPYFPELDKRCDLDYVPGSAREQRVDVAISESFGFGGQNGAVIIRRY